MIAGPVDVGDGPDIYPWGYDAIMGPTVDHWDTIFGRDDQSLSWFEASPDVSLELLLDDTVALRSVIDVGAGRSLVVDRLLDRGVEDITLLDLSARALADVRARLGERGTSVRMLATDVLEWWPDRTWDAWHDRAVLHFLVDDEDRRTYVARATAAVAPGGLAVIASFAPDGPSTCSGLPVHRTDADHLAAEFTDSFELVTSRDERHITPGGAEQHFVWVVLRRRVD